MRTIAGCEKIPLSSAWRSDAIRSLSASSSRSKLASCSCRSDDKRFFIGGSRCGLPCCSSATDGSSGMERRMVRSARRGMIGRTHGRGAGIGGGKAAGDEISIACGELFWPYTRSARERTPHGACIGSEVAGDGAEKGSSCKTSSVVVTARGRDGQWPGESSEEMDIDEPNEWSSSCGRHPSRATGDDRRCGSSMLQAAGASCGEERIAAMITPTYPRSATKTRSTK